MCPLIYEISKNIIIVTHNFLKIYVVTTTFGGKKTQYEFQYNPGILLLMISMSKE